MRDDFNPQGPRGPRQGHWDTPCRTYYRFQSTRPSRASTWYFRDIDWYLSEISIHKALAGLDLCKVDNYVSRLLFQSTRPSRASTMLKTGTGLGKRHFNPQGPRGPRRLQCIRNTASFRLLFQSTRPSRASTFTRRQCSYIMMYNFNPQGPRGPRPFVKKYSDPNDSDISIHKALAGLDIIFSMVHLCYSCNFNPQGPRGPRPMSRESTVLANIQSISIHKALAGLDFPGDMYRAWLWKCIFQSTRPSRASTCIRDQCCTP